MSKNPPRPWTGTYRVHGPGLRVCLKLFDATGKRIATITNVACRQHGARKLEMTEAERKEWIFAVLESECQTQRIPWPTEETTT